MLKHPLRFLLASLLAVSATVPNSVALAQDEGDEEQESVNVMQEVRISRQGLGLDPGALSFGGLILPPPPGSQVSDFQANQLNFHGFLRAPMRIGIGSGDDVEPGVPTGAKLHSPPRIPDGSYTEWSYTGDAGGPWTEMQFSWGNARVFATVQLASWNQSDSGYKNLVAQLGVNQAYVTVNLPDLFGDRGGILVNVGGFAGGYGAAGRYDAGAYGTYVFGRTHTTGETTSAFYDITDDITLQAEHGIGARLDVTPLIPGAPQLEYLPYAGPVQQFPTFLHHAHLGATFQDKIRFALHYLTQWTQASTMASEPDGRITSVGGELKAYDTRFGNAFLGVGFIKSKEALRVSGAFEAIHAWEGWNFVDNYFGATSRGNGDITTVSWEWTFSLATFLRYPQAFWGQGPDIIARTFGMWNKVSGDAGFSGAENKLKVGGSLTYTPLSWLGLSGRYDLVQPDMNNNQRSFHALAPRLLLRTEFVSHEEIQVTYTRYVLGSQTILNYPFNEQMVAPDKNVFSITATMWW